MENTRKIKLLERKKETWKFLPNEQLNKSSLSDNKDLVSFFATILIAKFIRSIFLFFGFYFLITGVLYLVII